jgi:hypothetical protein
MPDRVCVGHSLAEVCAAYKRFTQFKRMLGDLAWCERSFDLALPIRSCVSGHRCVG